MLDVLLAGLAIYLFVGLGVATACILLNSNSWNQLPFWEQIGSFLALILLWPLRIWKIILDLKRH